MGIEGIEHLTGNDDDFDQSDVESKTGDERETMCQEWWKASGEQPTDHNHICKLVLNHGDPCECNCGAVRPLEDHD